jgi:hypothetical protein
MKSISLMGRRSLFLIGTLAFLASSVYADDIRVIREKSFNVKDWQNLYVDVSGAGVKVESWDKQEVYIKVSGNERAEDKMKFDLFQDGDVVKVIIKRKNSFWNWFSGNIKLRVEAFVPKKFNAHVETSGGDISAKEITGGFKFETSGGDISTKLLNGKLIAETSGGDINLDQHKGNMNLSTSGGNIKCKLVDGEVDAETSGGDIHLDVSNGRIHAETSGGDIEVMYNGVNQGILAETSGGDIKVKLPADCKADVHLETSGGSVENNFTNSKNIKVKRSEITSIFNGGGPKIDLQTSGGSVTIE